MNPIITVAGVVPGTPEVTHWRTGFNVHPTGTLRPSRGPSISIAGAVSGAPSVPYWNVPYPNGESIYVAALRRAEAKAALEATETKVVELPKRASRTRAVPGEQRKAA